jgi:hypothetical protein
VKGEAEGIEIRACGLASGPNALGPFACSSSPVSVFSPLISICQCDLVHIYSSGGVSLIR